MTKFLDNLALGVVGTLIFLVVVVVLAIFIKFPYKNMLDTLLKIKILFTRYFYYINIKDWREEVWEKDLDDLMCCGGGMCGCCGETYRENFNR